MNTATPAISWHALAPEACLEALGASSEGLSTAQCAERLARLGLNRLELKAGRSNLRILWDQFSNVMLIMLLAVAAVSAGVAYAAQRFPKDAIAIVLIVGLNALLGYLQESRAQQALQALRDMAQPLVTVRRDGLWQRLPSEQLVPGDLIRVEAGDRVPADARLLEVAELGLREAALTGEAEAVNKLAGLVFEPSTPVLERQNCLFQGTEVVRGRGLAVVSATGMDTELGKIAQMINTAGGETTPLQERLDGLANVLVVSALALVAVVVVLGWLLGQRLLDLLEVALSMAVAIVPEGLPAVITVTLAIGTQRMVQRAALIRRLPAVEALGSVTVICTDKTGTLTRNEMVVAAAETADSAFAIDGEGYAPEGAIVPAGDLSRLARAAALCNDAALHCKDDVWTVEGDPMEGALLAFAGKVGGDHAARRLDAIPFDSRHRFMAVLTEGPQGRVTYVKGAPERVLRMCGGIDMHHWHDRAEAMARRGLRVLALAERPEAGEHVDTATLDHSLTFLGLVGLIDPPRPEAIAAVAECRAAGIRVKMITGDHAGTAAAIAAQIGLANPHRVLTGADLDKLDDAQLALEVADVDIFARTSPEHKLRLVTALQAGGLSVAMTGDGVNDAPALKRADAGIAMGLKGSEAAKEAADLVLADDNFASIAAAVREGRTVYDNLKKVISWTLPTNAGESMVVVLALLAGLALPVTAVQILWINLITGITLGLALAFEPTESGTMARPPRARNAPILSGELVWHVVLVATLFLAAVFGMFTYALDRGYSLPLAQTIAMNTLVVLEIFHLFFIRNIHGTSLTWAAARGTKVVWTVVIAITAAQFAITYVPLLQSVLGTEPVALFDGLLIVGIGTAFLAIIEIEKQIRLGLQRR